MNTKDELLILCDNLKFSRKSNRLSQKEMAEICGIGISSLRKIENGVLPPRLTIEPLLNVSSHFKIPPAKLFSSLKNATLAN